MKKNITILAAILFIATLTSYATVRTLSNDPAGGSQYNNLGTAYTASVNGDTILIEGTNISYNWNGAFGGCGSTNWAKSLTIIGIGFNPQKQSPRRVLFTKTGCGDNSLFLNAAGSGSSFYGIEFLVTVKVIENSVNNMLFEDCKFNGVPGFNFNSLSSSNVIFRNCIFDGNNTINIEIAGSGNVVSNVLVSNCIFDGTIGGAINQFVTMIIDHCIFLDGSFLDLYYATITNNIFMNTFPSGTGSSTYLNNICRVAGTFPPVGFGGNVGSGNINNTNPNFVNVPVSTFYSTALDFHLQSGSPASAAGSDGTDIGVHGGSSNFSEQGEVLINPIMRLVIINNTNVTPNGTLNVQINATKPDDN